MARLIIEDVDPLLIERLAERARKNGRSLQSELKQILETSDSSLNSSLLDQDLELVIQKAELMRQQLANHANGDITEVQAIDRKRASTLIQGFRRLRHKMSPGEVSIRDMREEGRRF